MLNRFKSKIKKSKNISIKKEDSADSTEKLSEVFGIDSSLTKQNNISSYISEEPSSLQDHSLLKALSFMDNDDD